MYVGKKIKQLRQTLDLTQEAMAGQLGVSRQYYISIEGGQKEISDKMLLKINENWSIDANFFDKENNVLPSEIIGGFDRGYNRGFRVSKNKNSNDNMPSMDVNHLLVDTTIKRRIHKQLQLKISQSNSAIKEIEFYLERLRDFEYILSDLNEYYFKNPEKVMETYSKYQRNGVFDYDAFNDDVLQQYEKLLKFKPAIKKLVHSLFDFYKDIEQLDEHDISATLYGYSRKDNPFNKD